MPLIAYTNTGNVLFGTASIGIEVWIFLLPFALAMLLADEARKGVLRTRGQKTQFSAAEPVSTS